MWADVDLPDRPGLGGAQACGRDGDILQEDDLPPRIELGEVGGRAGTAIDDDAAPPSAGEDRENEWVMQFGLSRPISMRARPGRLT